MLMANSSVLASKQMNVGVPLAAPQMSRQSSLKSGAPRTIISPRREVGSAGIGSRASSFNSQASAAVQIVEKKGDVAVWGPPRSQDGQSGQVPRILCYGDSTTAGYYDQGQRFQPYGQALAAALFEAGIHCEVAVCGLCSFTTQDMLKERSSESVKTILGPYGRGLKRMLQEDGPIDLVIIMTGTNDMGYQTSNATIVQHVAQLHSICHDHGVHTVALAPTQNSSRYARNLRQQLADMLATWASTATGVIDCLDVEDLIARPVGKDGVSKNPSAAVHWEPDDLHISAAGSLTLGRRLATHAASWLKQIEANGPVVSIKADHSSPRPSPVPSPRGLCRESFCKSSTPSLGQLPNKVLGSSRMRPCATPLQSTRGCGSTPLQSTRGCGFAAATRLQRQHRSHATSFSMAALVR